MIYHLNGRTISLTDRELQIARCLCARSEPTTKSAAAHLGVTPSTIDVTLTRLYKKLGVHTRLGMFRVLTELLDIKIP
jgi:DNA-binding CsgD family transcriptional regulator